MQGTWEEEIDTGPPPSYKKRKLQDAAASTCPDYLHHFFHYPEAPDDGGKPAVIHDNGKGIVERISYKELDNRANVLREVLDRQPFVNSGFIGVSCDLGIQYPAIILGILRSGKAFFNIDQHNWEDAVITAGSHFNLKYFICEPSWKPSPLHQAFVLRNVADFAENAVDFSFSVYEIILESPTTPLKINTNRTMPRFAYVIQTSGTTGRKKTVLVPHACICPNIYDFVHARWRLTSGDVIFGCAPPTFDPHIVELFTALAVGGTIIYASCTVKQSNHLLTNILANHRVTVLQITPSLFRQTYVAFSNRSEYLSLRIIAFGGEKCPSKSEVKAMRDAICPSSDILFQNIYGLTEVSCWASVSNIDLTSDDPISIGEGIRHTEIRVEGITGEIILTSSERYCVIIDAMQNVSDPATSTSTTHAFEYYTGDVGHLHGESIIFEGRMDRVVKRNGMKIPLFKIEEMALATGLVTYAECVLYRSKIVLLVQLKPEFRQVQKLSLTAASNVLLPSLSKALDIPLFMYPDFTVALNEIPLNSNGKLDCKSVIDSLVKVKEEKTSESIPFEVSKEQVVKTLDPIWRSCTYPGRRSIDLILKENFIAMGGDSISAARFVESAFLSLKLFGSDTHDMYELEVKERLIQGTFDSVVELVCQIISRQNCLSTNFSNFTNDLNEMQELLSPAKSFDMRDNFESKMNDETMVEYDGAVFNQVDSSEFDPGSSCEIASPIQIVNMYNVTLALCVDASPTIVKGEGNTGAKAIVGCHGGILLCMDLSVLRNSSKSSNLAIAWKRRLPGRLEASVVTDGSGLYGFVGCHDSNFYKFSVSTGETVCYTGCNAPVRSKAAVNDEHQLVIVVDSANCIYCLNYNDLNIIWMQTSYTFLATTSPISCRNMSYISTLGNGLIALDLHTGKENWSSCNKSYYTSPTLIYDKGENAIKPRKKKYLVLTGSLTSSKNEIVEARNAKTGKIEWTYFVPSISPHPIVSQPMYNKCCDNIAWISLSDFRLKSLNSFNGKLSHERCCYFTDENEAKSCCLVSCRSVDKSRMSECAVFYKVNKMNNFMVVNLHNNQFLLMKPWFMVKDFDTFSVPVSTDEYILFGGRDNNLHVIKCKLINKQITT